MSFLQSISHQIIATVIGLMILVIFIEVIFSWLIAFNIVNLKNPTMAQIYRTISRIAAPILGPFRKIIPPVGGLDLSPIAAFILLAWLQSLFSYGGAIYRMLG